MGALGVLMAIGLFEVDGGCAEKPFYEITSPLFDKVTYSFGQPLLSRQDISNYNGRKLG